MSGPATSGSVTAEEARADAEVGALNEHSFQIVKQTWTTAGKSPCCHRWNSSGEARMLAIQEVLWYLRFQF